MQIPQHNQRLGSILINIKGVQHKKKLERARLSMELDLKTKLLQTHVLKKYALLKIPPSPWTKTMESAPYFPYA